MTTDPTRPTHAIDRAVADAPWFRSGATVLIAASGGPDSMALLAALDSLARRRAGLRVVAAHLDHRLRTGSHRDRGIVEAFASEHGIEVIADSADVAAIAVDSRASIETAGRSARYRFLRAAASRAGADWIATAHTRSDQVETVLMRLLRGTGERGLAGIPAERDAIVRPLLGVDRRDTRDYCTGHGIPFAVDPTNDDRRFARNAIRHDVLPALRRAYPDIDAFLVRRARRALDTLERVRDVTTPRLDRALVAESDGSWALRVRAFDGLDGDAAAILLGDALARTRLHDDVASAHYTALIDMARDAHAVGSSIDVPGASVRRDHDALVFRPHAAGTPHPQRGMALLAVPGSARFGDWTLRAEMVSDHPFARGTHPVSPDGAWVAYLSPDVDVARLCARAPRPGDCVRPLGMNGRKKVSDVFIDRKIPHRERARALVVEAGDEIVWIPGIVTAEGARVRRDHPAAVRLVATRGTPAGPEAP